MRLYATAVKADEGSVVVFEALTEGDLRQVRHPAHFEPNVLHVAVDHRYAQDIVDHIETTGDPCPIEVEAWQLLGDCTLHGCPCKEWRIGQ